MALLRQQRALHHVWFFLDQTQKGCSRSTDPALSLLPLPVAGQTHAHQWGHLGLGQVRSFAHFPRSNRVVDDGRPFAFCMGEGFGHCLDQVVAKGAHLFSFRVALRAADSAETARFSSGVMSP